MTIVRLILFILWCTTYQTYCQQEQELKVEAKVENLEFGNDERVQDIEHIASHLEDSVDVHQKNISEKQAKFYYFKLLDLDHNRKLDGLEIIKEIEHDHKTGQEVMTDDRLEKYIDMALQKYDKNGDGYIDWPEFAVIHIRQDKIEEIQKTLKT